MKRWLVVLLGLSLLLNLGVLVAVGYHTLRAEPPHLEDYLKLSEPQRRQWHEMEHGFMQELNSAWGDIRAHRERMIRQIFSGRPDAAVIEAERAAISRLQEQQQRRVIEQLMAERNMLDPAQRAALAELLLRQEPPGTLEERLHGK
ncbi:MAG: periplasmic heavy metal sensor [Gammaproteobacteria bacterium]|nr:MAG: periplasmic heavy metal sensor [Gammaproteobacteria bacterium]